MIETVGLLFLSGHMNNNPEEVGTLGHLLVTNRQRNRIGDEERRLMHLVPAPAVRLMKRRVLSTPGLNSLMS